ncbi:DUF2934 domain-containing protein [Salipiger marinus]|uniref:DUF2934 domain-containing protein n=1 Tax=Salipiger marinus TaxID=555512 RepID=A0A1G8R913_9RHOB|nr:DUF2934 domain-containing protein [Salipiger marinus]SDJ13472.1 Protein of unknown function [Salipiger marinus]
MSDPHSSRETPPPLSPQAQAEAAYFLWLAEGRPEGRAAEHWAEAEAALAAKPHRRKTAEAKAPKAPKAAKPKSAKPAKAAPAEKPAKAKAPRKPRASPES